MKPTNENKLRTECSPVDMLAETVEEENLISTIKILIASGKVTEADVFYAWRLGFSA